MVNGHWGKMKKRLFSPLIPNNQSQITNNSSFSASLRDLCGLAVNILFKRRCGQDAHGYLKTRAGRPCLSFEEVSSSFPNDR